MVRNRTEQPECQHCQARFKSVFCDMSEADLSAMSASKECHMYKKGQVIFHEGSRPRGLYCINSGKIKLSMLGDEGKEQILHLSRAGDIMGYRAILSGDNYSCSATAIEDSSVCFIPRSTFFEMVENGPSLSLQLMKLLGSELATAEKNITDLAQKPVRERLAEALLFMKETYGLMEDGCTIDVNLTREEISNIVGTATETTIRFLSEFQKDGIVELHGRNIRILNLEKLVSTANIID